MRLFLSFALENLWMEYEEQGHGSLNLKESRKPLEMSRTEPIYVLSRSSDNTSIILFVIVAFIAFFVALIKCCINNCMEETISDENERRIHPPPPRNHLPIVRRTYGSSRPLAPPMTHSRSLILLPEETDNHTLFIIENPNFILSAANLDVQERRNSNSESGQHLITGTIVDLSCNYERRNSNPRPDNHLITGSESVLDLPPDYESVIGRNTQTIPRVPVTNTSNNYVKEYGIPPPKYEDLHK